MAFALGTKLAFLWPGANGATSVGFVGGGAILKSGRVVTGTATAASLWGTGAVGVAVAWQRYEIAIALRVAIRGELGPATRQ